MPRLKSDTAKKRAFEKVQEFLKKQGVKEAETMEMPLMTHEEEMYEAQAVLNYFSLRIKPRSGGDLKGWTYRRCAGCGEEFVYSYAYEGIKSCSIKCMADQLEAIGLKWTPGRDLRLRWDRAYPAIVPSNVFAMMKPESEETDDASEETSDVPSA